MYIKLKLRISLIVNTWSSQMLAVLPFMLWWWTYCFLCSRNGDIIFLVFWKWTHGFFWARNGDIISFWRSFCFHFYLTFYANLTLITDGKTFPSQTFLTHEITQVILLWYKMKLLGRCCCIYMYVRTLFRISF